METDITFEIFISFLNDFQDSPDAINHVFQNSKGYGLYFDNLKINMFDPTRCWILMKQRRIHQQHGELIDNIHVDVDENYKLFRCFAWANGGEETFPVNEQQLINFIRTYMEKELLLHIEKLYSIKEPST